MSFILIEGPDGSGKTTLVNNLLKAHPGSVTVHFSNPKTKEEADNYWKVYSDAIYYAKPNVLTIFDRCWISDRVYGPIFRNRQEMSIEHTRLLESAVIANGGGFLFYCTAPINTLWKRCTTRGEDFVQTREQLEQISESYATEVKYCTLPVVRYDTSVRW